MAIPRTGGCLCGAIRYESDGDVMFALRCHCRDCQRQSGAASVAAIRVPAARFHVTRARRNALWRKRIAATKSHGCFAAIAEPRSMSRSRPGPMWSGCVSARLTIPAGFVRTRIFSSKARNPGNQWTPRCPDIQTIHLASPIRSEAADDPRGRLSRRKPPPVHPASLTPALGNPASACGHSFCHATPISGDPIGVARWAQDCDLAEPYRFGSRSADFPVGQRYGI